jgi:hypothetical protein
MCRARVFATMLAMAEIKAIESALDLKANFTAQTRTNIPITHFAVRLPDILSMRSDEKNEKFAIDPSAYADPRSLARLTVAQSLREHSNLSRHFLGD